MATNEKKNKSNEQKTRTSNKNKSIERMNKNETFYPERKKKILKIRTEDIKSIAFDAFNHKHNLIQANELL